MSVVVTERETVTQANVEAGGSKARKLPVTSLSCDKNDG